MRRIKTLHSTVFSLFLLFPLSGCAGVFFDQEKDKREVTRLQNDLVREYREKNPERVAAGGDKTQINVLNQYALIDKTGFLQKKIAAALKSSPDLSEMRARYRQAEAALRSANAAYFPVLSANAGASRQSRDFSAAGNGGNNFSSGGFSGSGAPQGRESFASYSAGVSADLTRDLLGSEDEAFRAAEARLKAAKADRKTARILLINGVAEAYVRITAAKARLRIARETEKLFQNTLFIAEKRYETGTPNVTVGDVLSARESVATARSQTVQAEKTLSLAFNQFDYLTANVPGTARKDEKFFRTPIIQSPPPAFLPVDLLDMRSDLQAAGLRTVAVGADINVSVARLYPDFSLSLSAESVSDLIKNALKPETVILTMAGRLNAVLFDGGALRAGVDISKEEYEILKARYRALLLSALQEVDNAGKETLFTYKIALQSREALKIATAAEEAAMREYIAGVRTFSALTDLQRRRYAAEQARADARAEEALARIRLFSAFFLPVIGKKPE